MVIKVGRIVMTPIELIRIMHVPVLIVAAGFGIKTLKNEYAIYGSRRVDLEVMKKYDDGDKLLTEKECANFIKGEFDKDDNETLSHAEQLEFTRYAGRPFQFSYDVSCNMRESFRNLKQAFKKFPKEGTGDLRELDEELRSQFK